MASTSTSDALLHSSAVSSNDDEREERRRQRAIARGLNGMTFELGTSPDDQIALYDDATTEERLQAMARLCRAAWLVSGRAWPSCARKDLPGEVFRIDHVARRPT